MLHFGVVVMVRFKSHSSVWTTGSAIGQSMNYVIAYYKNKRPSCNNEILLHLVRASVRCEHGVQNFLLFLYNNLVLF